MNLALGHAAAGHLWSVLKRKFEAFPDPLSWGPAGDFSPESPEPWIRERLNYWNQLASPRKNVTERDFTASVRTIDVIRGTPDLTLWMAHDFDSVVLAAWVTFLHHTCGTGCHLQLVQFPPEAGSAINAMPADVLQSFPSPQRVQATTLDFLLAFWEAWSASTPHRLMELVRAADREESSQRLFSAWLDRYPNSKTGLTHWDHALLRAVRDHGPSLASVVANSMIESGGSVESVGDLWLKARLARMAQSPVSTPLVTIDRPNPKRPFIGHVHLTGTGEQVLSGQTSVLGRYWPDDWVGGVRISASHPVWVRTPDGLVEWSPSNSELTCQFSPHRHD